VLNSAPPTDGSTPPYKSTSFEQQWQIYLGTFDQDYAVDVPAGDHTIGLDVVAGDWLSVQSYRLTNYRSNKYADTALTGTAHAGTALVWAQNLQHNWKNVSDGVAMQTIHAGSTTVTGLPPGKYGIDWFDTETGLLLEHVTAYTTNTGLPLILPDFSTDIAAKIHAVK
jgi:hypothetical protein